MARQPTVQVPAVVLQIRPERTVPQSSSLWQPQVPPVKQRPPAPAARQALVLVGVHSTQVLVAPQTKGAVQPVVPTH
jgi:hypothetical protein